MGTGFGGSLSVAVGVRQTQSPEGDDDPEQELTRISRPGQDHRERSDQEGEAPDGRDLAVEGPECRAIPDLLWCLLSGVRLGEGTVDEYRREDDHTEGSVGDRLSVTTPGADVTRVEAGQ